MIIPSIDLMGGKAVQLRQGQNKVLERENVIELARLFNRYGQVAVIDLDAAMGRGNNEKLIKKLCSIIDCRVGGGIRSEAVANRMLTYGAKKIIIGTEANPQFLKNLNPERVIAAVDSKAGKVVTHGWKKNSDTTTIDKIQELESYCSEFLYTNVDREGMLEGILLDQIETVKNSTKNSLTYAGGITTPGEVISLENMGINSQIGMAIYQNNIQLDRLYSSLVDFSKGLVPTIVQDRFGQVLMLAYSSPQSLELTLSTGKATYYSRSRDELWIKGATSGNFQELLKARYDCDRDSLLFTVDQKQEACHKGGYSCFSDREFSLKTLYDVIEYRIKKPSPHSYTSRIASEETKILSKISEEAGEVANYRNRENLVWELADLSYFMLVLMAKKGILPEEVENELWRRRK